MITIRLATSADLGEINDIYNHYVKRSTCTYQEELEAMENRAAWFERHGSKHPITVATLDGEIVGWGSISPFKERVAYRNTVESSVYVAHTHHRRGIGRALLEDLIERARAAGHHTTVAIIDAQQPASVALHAACGFEQVALLREVGYKFGRWLDVIYMQLMLSHEQRH